jgi:hypothetical protein
VRPSEVLTSSSSDIAMGVEGLGTRRSVASTRGQSDNGRTALGAWPTGQGRGTYNTDVAIESGECRCGELAGGCGIREVVPVVLR